MAAVLKFGFHPPNQPSSPHFRICETTRRPVLCHLAPGLLTKLVSKMLANAEALNIWAPGS
jgi:hypothetical protein